MWSALPEKVIDNAVKDYHKQLQARVCQQWIFWTYNVIIHITDTNSYISFNVILCDLFLMKKSFPGPAE